MRKSVLIALLVHAVVLSLVWVGFPVPMPRSGVQFSYSGSFSPVDEIAARDTGPKPRPAAVEMPNSGAGFFAPWIEMRDLDKPRK